MFRCQRFFASPLTLAVRSKSTLAGYAINSAVVSLQNGILEKDDYYRNGIPKPRFELPLWNESTNSDNRHNLLTRILSQHSSIDPFKMLAQPLKDIHASIRKDLVASDHPLLNSVAKYLFEATGKHIRPSIVLLISKALSFGLRSAEIQASNSSLSTSSSHSTYPLQSPSFYLNITTAPSKTTSAGISASLFGLSSSSEESYFADVLPEQRRLSEITEMIHTASLLHDDVIDEAATRRGIPSVNFQFGNKLAILGGDFLLARASVALARLRNPDVIELLSIVIEHLVKGEILQMKPSLLANNTLDQNMTAYLTKTYYKTASLIANSCKAVAILAGHSSMVQEIAYEYGKSIGLAFQIVDDILDFTGSAKSLGKPALHDLEQGIVTAPILFAMHEFPEMKTMMERKFKQSGDIEKALGFIERSNAIEKSRDLAVKFCESAVSSILHLEPSKAQSALINLVDRVLNRDH